MKKNSLFVLNIISKVFYFLAAAFLILVVTYFFGFPFLQALYGNDTPNTLTLIYWFNRFFPKIPLWFPLQGGGVSFVQGYPLFVHYLVIFIHRIFNLSLPAAFQILGFLSLPAVALGLYLFVWKLTKSQTAALVAGIFYLLSPITYVWLFDWGFYVESIAYFFVFPSLIFIQFFLENHFLEGWSKKASAYLALAILFLCLTFLAHLYTFASVLLISTFLSFFLYLFRREKKWAFKSLLIHFCLLLLVVSVLSFWLINLSSYNRASGGFHAPLSREDFVFNYTIYPRAYLNLEKIPREDPRYSGRNVSLAVVVWVLAVAGAALSILFSKKILALSLLLGLVLLALFFPVILWVLSLIPLVTFFTAWRSFVAISRFLFPILAGAGVYFLGLGIVKLLFIWDKKERFRFLKSSLTAILALVISLTSTVALARVGMEKHKARWGPEEIDFREIQILNLENWPKPKLATEFEPTELAGKIIETIPEKESRIDLTPYYGGVVMQLNIVSDLSQVNLYAPALSLLGPYWGYQQQVFYGTLGSQTALNNLAKYFGTNYVVLCPELDNLAKYKNNLDWEEITADIWKHKEEMKLFSFYEKKPIALLIGNEEKRAFEPFFRIANEGVLNFDQAILVQGKENIDEYTLSELKNFDLLILFGYSYKNQKKAYDLVDQYLKDGGKVFLSTGWQFIDHDWQIEIPPAFFPVKNLVWRDDIKSGQFRMEEREIKDVDASFFSPLIWEEKPWGVSLSTRGLKDWAKPILAFDDKVLVAGGNYGKGRIVWTGLNWPGHIHTYDYNREEIKFVNKVFSWLIGEIGSEEKNLVEMKRDWPDRVEFVFKKEIKNSGTLLFREAVAPDWRASLDGKRLKIYKAGPGFILVRVPKAKAGAKLVLEYSQGARGAIGWLISLTALVFLLDFLFLKKLVQPLTCLISQKVTGFYGQLKEFWKREDEY